MTIEGKPHRFRLIESSVETRLMLFVYVLCGLVLLIYLDNIKFSPWILALIVFLIFFEGAKYLKIRKPRRLDIILYPKSLLIEIVGEDRSKKYSRFSIYSCRWFAILSVPENLLSRNILLTKDRFTSTSEYFDLRFMLLDMTRKIDAD